MCFKTETGASVSLRLLPLEQKLRGLERQARLREIVATTVEAPLDDGIIRPAILLRQQQKISRGDSIIAATALEFDVPLITRNTDDFKHIGGIQIINPFQ